MACERERMRFAYNKDLPHTVEREEVAEEVEVFALQRLGVMDTFEGSVQIYDFQKQLSGHFFKTSNFVFYRI